MSSNYSFLYHCFYFTHEVSIFSQIFNDIKVFFFFFSCITFVSLEFFILFAFIMVMLGVNS